MHGASFLAPYCTRAPSANADGALQAFSIDDACCVPSFAAAVLSLGGLLWQGATVDLASQSPSIVICGVCTPVLVWNDLFFVDLVDDAARVDRALVVMSTIPAPPPLLAASGSRHSPAVLARGLELTDAVMVHALFSHVGDRIARATLSAYGHLAPCSGSFRCNACDATRLQRAPTYSDSRGDPDGAPPPLREWRLGLIGPISPVSRYGSRYLMHAVQPTSGYKWGAGVDAKSDTARVVPQLHGAVSLLGVAPLVFTTNSGGEFTGAVWDGICSRLGVQHRLRAPESHVDAIEFEHKHAMGAARAAIAAAHGATARDWEDAALGAIENPTSACAATVATSRTACSLITNPISLP